MVMATPGEQIIKEKIEGLNDLPVGYTPNLQSKWEVLENGLKPEKKPLLFAWSKYLSIAASLLFIGGASLLLIKQTSTKPKPQAAIVVQPKRKIDVAKAPVLSTTIKVKQVYAKSSNIQKVSVEQVLPQTDTLKSNTTPPDQPLALVEALVETIPAKKPKRFEEIDFNTPVIGASVPTQTYVESQKFRFRLNIGGSAKITSSKPTQPEIGFRTSF